MTLVVTEDLDVVRRECDNVPRAALQATRVLGCQMSKPLRPDGALPVRAIKIVRFAESLPSLVTFEIDQAAEFRKQGQTIDAVLQLTEAEKVSRALGMNESAQRIRAMMNEIRGE